ENVPPPPEEKALRDFLSTLPEETIYQLILITHLGHGYFATGELAGYYESLKGIVGGPEDAAAEMMAFDTTLADQLSDGLDELRKHKINLDKLPLKKVKVRKR